MPKAKAVRFQLPKAKLLKYNARGKAVSFTPPVLDEVDREYGWFRDMVSPSAWVALKPFAEQVLRTRPDLFDETDESGGTAS